MKKKELLVLCGGQSPEHKVSLMSAKNVIAAVNRDKFNISLVGISLDGRWERYCPEAFLSDVEDPNAIALSGARGDVALGCADRKGYLVDLTSGAKTAIDVAFPVLHGAFGEDGAVQGALKIANIPYVGCDIASSSLCMDKDMTKRVLAQAGVSVADGTVLRRENAETIDYDKLIMTFSTPLFVKPARLGSSVGISKVRDAVQLRDAVEKAFQYDPKVLVEAFVKGREIECAVLGNEGPKASVPGEVIPLADFYTYEAKYVDAEGAKLEAPARLSSEVAAKVQEMAIRSFQALGCEGLSRVDFFLTEDNRLLVNEINTIPGFTKISMYPRLWGLSGVSYPELVERLIALAIARFEREQALLVS